MNKGVEFFLKSIGVTITPEELERAFEQGKAALPRIAQAYNEMNARMERMEQKMELLLSRTGGEVQSDPIHESYLDNTNPEALRERLLNGSPALIVKDNGVKPNA